MMPMIQSFLLMLEGSLAASLTVKATLVMSIALAVVLGPARKSRASLRHILLAAAFAVLTALPIAAILAPPVPILVSAPQQSQVVVAAPAVVFHAEASAVAINAPDAPVNSRPPRLSLSALLTGAWLLGMAVFLLPLVVGLRQVRRLRRVAIPWRDGQALAEDLARRAGIRRRVEVSLDETVSGPTTYGAMKPVILLPFQAETWEADDLNRAFVHELEHVRRRDWMSHCLARVVCSVYWFHPLVWMMWRQFALDAERACDDAVLGCAEATAYADQLVVLAQRVSALRRSPGLAMANRADLTARVGALLDGRQRRGRAGMLPVALAWFAAAVLVVVVSPLLIVAAPQVATSQFRPTPTAVALPVQTPPVVLAQLAPPVNNDTPYAAPPPPPPNLGSFSASTMLVITDATVNDANGNAIEGLRADDFVITEDGKQQAVQICEFQKLDDASLIYYVLGYYTSNNKLDNAYRKVNVAVKNHPEARLDFRAGYYSARRPVSDSSDAIATNYTTGDGFTSPSVLTKFDPEYSDEARKAKYSGTVELIVDINTSGQVTHAAVTKSLGMGLDEKAFEAVMKWKFRPAMKDGKPVDAQSAVSLAFRLL